jgi:glycosyltransferase involved in cell wall biosynthesis
LLSGNEGLPLVVLEAVSAGIPVIATDVGVVKEYFSPGTGVLFLRERSPDLILDHLECLQQKEFRERIIHQGTEYFFAHLSPDIVTDRILALYQGC